MSITLPSTARRAETALPTNDLLAERWSPRSFDPTAEISDDQLTTMLEAARWAEYDLGQSLAHLTVQAHAEGLHVHQVGGFDAARISSLFALPEEFTPVSVTTIGVVSDVSQLEEPYAAREVAARSRLPLEDLILGTR